MAEPVIMGGTVLVEGDPDIDFDLVKIDDRAVVTAGAGADTLLGCVIRHKIITAEDGHRELVVVVEMLRDPRAFVLQVAAYGHALPHVPLGETPPERRGIYIRGLQAAAADRSFPHRCVLCRCAVVEDGDDFEIRRLSINEIRAESGLPRLKSSMADEPVSLPAVRSAITMMFGDAEAYHDAF